MGDAVAHAEAGGDGTDLPADAGCTPTAPESADSAARDGAAESEAGGAASAGAASADAPARQSEERVSSTGPPRKSRSTLALAAKTVLLKVKVEAAFGTLRKQAVIDKLDITHMDFERELGRGSFGKVSLYRWKPGATETVNGELIPRSGLVAVKSLLPDVTGNASAMHDFHAEIDVLSRLSHSCLVACIGTGEMTLKTGESVLFMAMEAVTGGDLHTAVLGAMSAASTSSSSPLPFYKDADVVRWCHDISRGLHYLHTRSPMLIHRDLKLENVLLDAHWNAKITDLGLIKSLVRPRASETQAGADDTYKMTGGTGSLRYLAPENFLGKPYNEKTDIYSFSIIVWELLARTPLLFMRSKRVGHARVEYTPKLWALDAAKDNVRPELRPEWPAALRTLMAECWDADPARRPSARVVVEKLHPMLQPALFTDPTKAPASDGCCSVQ